jgi:hypothetical protein
MAGCKILKRYVYKSGFYCNSVLLILGMKMPSNLHNKIKIIFGFVVVRVRYVIQDGIYIQGLNL